MAFLATDVYRSSSLVHLLVGVCALLKQHSQALCMSLLCSNEDAGIAVVIGQVRIGASMEQQAQIEAARMEQQAQFEERQLQFESEIWDWLSELALCRHWEATRRWATRVGACSMAEVSRNLEAYATEIGLTTLEQGRLVRGAMSNRHVRLGRLADLGRLEGQLTIREQLAIWLGELGLFSYTTRGLR